MKKTTNPTIKTISLILLVALFSSQNTFAQKQSLEIENNSLSHNVTFMLCVLFFIIGFIALIALKLRDDNKQEQKGQQNQQMHSRHRNHYGSKHQYNHN